MGRVSNAKQLLLDAAIKLMWQRGYNAVSVDDICKEAGVKKGSVYHFFSSKAQLASEALRIKWEEDLPYMEAVFSKDIPPLQRIMNYAEEGYKYQTNLKETTGYACGCPYFDLGSEVANMEKELADTVVDIMNKITRYVEESIIEANELGELSVKDPAQSAKWLFCFFEGALTNARIHNDPELLKDAAAGALNFLRGNN